MEILRQFGGFEIASLVGFYLGAASAGVAVVIDGFICAAADLLFALRHLQLSISFSRINLLKPARTLR